MKIKLNGLVIIASCGSQKEVISMDTTFSFSKLFISQSKDKQTTSPFPHGIRKVQQFNKTNFSDDSIIEIMYICEHVY